MRSHVRWFAPALLAAAIAGCGGGIEAGLPKDAPSGPPPTPPGTANEMTKGPMKPAPFKPPG
jgi:hypothetical protein